MAGRLIWGRQRPGQWDGGNVSGLAESKRRQRGPVPGTGSGIGNRFTSLDADPAVGQVNGVLIVTGCRIIRVIVFVVIRSGQEMTQVQMGRVAVLVLIHFARMAMRVSDAQPRDQSLDEGHEQANTA